MPTILTHAAVPIALSLAAGQSRIPPSLLLLGVVASIAPDLDVVAFRLGIPYADGFGHRGASHSILGAVLICLALLPFAAWRRLHIPTAIGFVGFSAMSHGLLDMMTNGGLGVALAWPWSDHRYFLPCRVIEVSPIGVHRLFSGKGLAVMRSEMMWVWAPAMLLAALARTMRLRAASGIALRPREAGRTHD